MRWITFELRGFDRLRKDYWTGELYTNFQRCLSEMILDAVLKTLYGESDLSPGDVTKLTNTPRDFRHYSVTGDKNLMEKILRVNLQVHVKIDVSLVDDFAIDHKTAKEIQQHLKAGVWPSEIWAYFFPEEETDG